VFRCGVALEQVLVWDTFTLKQGQLQTVLAVLKCKAVPNQYLLQHTKTIHNLWLYAAVVLLMANWIGHILRRNCLLQQVIEGNIKGGTEVTGRRGRRSRKLLDNLKEMRGYSHLKEEALDRAM
jgi:hypothetical protein